MSSAMFRFFLRRDRVWLPAWLLGVVLMNVIFAPALTNIVPTAQDLAGYAETLKNPAMIAMCGPMYGTNYTYGIMYVQMIFIWCVILIAVMNIFLVSRHTRKDEDDGQTEILRSLPVGRNAGLLATMELVVAANVIQGMFSGLILAAIGVTDMSAAGCILIGAVYSAVGILFGGIAMLFAQLAQTSRGLVGYAFGVLGIFYIMRAVGDVKGNILSDISPMGIMFKTEPFVKNSWLPVTIILVEGAVIIAASFILNSRRDFGSGFIPQRSGRRHSGVFLGGETGLAWRLIKTPAIIWVLVMLMLGASYGSIFGDFETFMKDNAMIRQLIVAGSDSGSAMLNSFVGYIMLVMSLVACVPVLITIMKLRGEEKKNRLEQVYACAVSRTKYISSYVLHSFVLSVALQVALAVGLWASARQVMSDPLSFKTVILSALIMLPAMWIIIAIATFLTGLLPKFTSLVWVYFGVAFFLTYLGRMLSLPKWLPKLSPFGFIPNYPTDSITAAPLVIITAVAVLIVAGGIAAYGRRETLTV